MKSPNFKLCFFVVVLGLVSPVATEAAPLLFTFSGVTFADNAVATGSFIFDPGTDTFGAFNITTTVGMTTDTYLGSNYSSVLGTAPSGSLSAGEDVFVFDNFSSGLHDSHYLALGVATNITSPGTYALEPGVSGGPGSFRGSGEFVDGNLDLRLVRAATSSSPPRFRRHQLGPLYWVKQAFSAPSGVFGAVESTAARSRGSEPFAAVADLHVAFGRHVSHQIDHGKRKIKDNEECQSKKVHLQQIERTKI